MKNSDGEEIRLYRVTVGGPIYVLANSRCEAEIDATDAFRDGCELGLFAIPVNETDQCEEDWRGALPYGNNGCDNEWTVDEIFELMKSGQCTKEQ